MLSERSQTHRPQDCLTLFNVTIRKRLNNGDREQIGGCQGLEGGHCLQGAQCWATDHLVLGIIFSSHSSGKERVLLAS